MESTSGGDTSGGNTSGKELTAGEECEGVEARNGGCVSANSQEKSGIRAIFAATAGGAGATLAAIGVLISGEEVREKAPES